VRAVAASGVTGETRTGYALVAPAFAMLVLVLGLPALSAVLQSFNLVMSRTPGFSLESYERLLTDPEFRQTIANTVVYVSGVVAIHLSLGLSVALLLNADIRGKWFFRVVALLPWTVPDVIGGIIWRFMFDALPGMVNAVVIRSGLADAPVDWLGDPQLAFAALVLAEGWRGYPFIMLILLAGLQSIPRTLYEAAAMDGARAWQSFLYVTLPNLKNMFIIALVLDVIWECRLFGMVFGMTAGGPGNATQVLSVMTYRHYFEFFNTSYASAAAVVLAVFMLAISIPYLRMSMRVTA
jgi:multiple sugar transport system permease protein